MYGSGVVVVGDASVCVCEIGGEVCAGMCVSV